AVPPTSLVATWAAFNVGLALLVPYLAFRSIRPTLTLGEAALPMCMLLCWGGFRTLLQFTLVAVVFSLLSMLLADKRRTLAVVCVVGSLEGKRKISPLYSAPALAGLWSLLVFRHLTYGFILLLPLAALLWLDTNPGTATFRKRVFWFLQIAMMADVPGLWRRFGHLIVEAPAADGWFDQVDRLVMIALFVCVLKLAS